MIGVDIVFIPRIAKAIEKDNFVNGVFTADERAYCDGRGERVNSYAGLFSAKEAVVKALKCGYSNGIMPKDVEIAHNESGAPLVLLSEKIKDLFGECSVDVSISHDGEYAIAVATRVK